MLSRLSELGTLTTTIDRDTFRIATGFRGKLPGDFNYEAYYQHGRLTTSQKDFEAFSRTKFAETLNVSDNGTTLSFSDDFCANPTARAQGCVPFNFFGQPKPVSQALLDYIGINSGVETEASQTVVSGFVSGSLFRLPASDVGVVVGSEYRKESAEIVPASSYVDFTNSIRFLAGFPKSSYDVREFFGEVNIPLLGDTRFFRRVEVGGAIRFSDYSTVGSKTSWSVRGEWEVSPDIRFRGVYSTAVRAPNLKELY